VIVADENETMPKTSIAAAVSWVRAPFYVRHVFVRTDGRFASARAANIWCSGVGVDF
jgi:hypothetical protein